MKVLVLVLVPMLALASPDGGAVVDVGLPVDAPTKGVCLDEAATVRVAQRLVSLEAENESLKKSVAEAPVVTLPVGLAIAGAAALALAGGVALGYSLAPKAGP